MTTTMEQQEIQLQQELFTLKAQDAARVQITAAVQARLLTTAQVRKGTPSLHRCERSWTSEGILLQGRGFPTVVDED